MFVIKLSVLRWVNCDMAVSIISCFFGGRKLNTSAVYNQFSEETFCFLAKTFKLSNTCHTHFPYTKLADSRDSVNQSESCRRLIRAWEILITIIKLFIGGMRDSTHAVRVHFYMYIYVSLHATVFHLCEIRFIRLLHFSYCLLIGNNNVLWKYDSSSW